MTGDSVYLAALQTMAGDSGADILSPMRDVRRAACALLKKWWCSFGYNYVLTGIQTRLREVITLV
jgi:hypothetical protein